MGGQDPISTRLQAQRRKTEASPTLGSRHIEETRTPSSAGADAALPSGAALGREHLTVETVLGVGATGHVYAVRDRNLDRSVAVKVLIGGGEDIQEGERFLREARITAALQHPNILPVYEFDRTAHGQPYFAMKRIDGMSLGSMIELAREGKRPAAIAGAAAMVSVMIGVTRAVAYAHHRGYVHQDIKPDNIVVANFGEVLLVDWGSARQLRGIEPDQRYGTPLYMSPEQARGEDVDERCDVYSLGATLFHMLLLRPATWATDPERFWAMKRAGEIQAPSAAESATIPRSLIAIVLRALRPKAAERYANAQQLLEELERWQAGLAVEAYRESWLERLRRWHGAHARSLWLSVLAAAAVLALAMALYGQRLREMADWGSPVYADDFADPGWAKRWQILKGDFRVDGTEVVTSGKTENVMLLDRRWGGPTAVEYDARMDQGSRPCDISLVWFRTRPHATDVDASAFSGDSDCLFLQFGAFDGSYSMIKDVSGNVLAYDDFRPESGRWYHMRVEVAGSTIQAWVDGKRLMQWIDPFPLDDGYFAIYGHYEGKRFAHIRVFAQRPPELLPAIATGDILVHYRKYAEAAEQYARVAADWRGTALQREALYRQGLCQYQSGDASAAYRTWQPLAGSAQGQLVELQRLDQLLDQGQDAELARRFEGIYRAGSEEVRMRARMRWNIWTSKLRLMKSPPKERLAVYLALHDRCLADQGVCDLEAAATLVVLGRYQDVLDRYPHQRRTCAEALQGQGKLRQMANDYNDQAGIGDMAALEVGRFDVVRSGTGIQLFHAWALMYSGRFDEALALKPRVVEAAAPILAYLGRIDEAQACNRDEWTVNEALAQIGAFDRINNPLGPCYRLLAEGRIEEALKGHVGVEVETCKHVRLVEELRRGDLAGAKRDLAPWPFSTPDLCLFDKILYPAFASGRPDGAALQAAAAALADDPEQAWHLQQRPHWYGMLACGRCGRDEYLHQPMRMYIEATCDLILAVRAECAGDRAQAIAQYRAWLAIPPYQVSRFYFPAYGALVHWRLEALAAAQP